MVTGIVHTALAVEAAVAVRIKLGLMLLDPFIRQVDALVILAVLLQRNRLILHMAVAAPLEHAGALAALVGIVEGQRVLDALGVPLAR